MGRRSEGFKLRKFEWSPYWYITYSIDGRSKRHSTDKESHEEAEYYKARFLLEFGKKQQEENQLTVSECLEDYMNEHAINTASAATAGYLRKPLEAYFGDILVEDLRPGAIKEYTEKKRKEKVSDGSIRRQLTILSAAFNHARKEGRLAIAPHVPMPSQSAPKERWLTRNEAQRLLDACEAHIRLFVAVALFTGARKGAILSLDWKQIDLKQRVIDFRRPGPQQINKRRAVVPINDDLYAILNDMNIKRGRLIQFKGQPVLDIKKGFAAACKRAGMKKVTPHTLRHTCGTWLAQAGVDMWQISGILGHSNSRTTELYLKHSPDHLRDAVQGLGIVRKLRSKTIKNSKKQQKRVKGNKRHAA